VESFAPALRELPRFIARIRLGMQLSRAQRELDAAETELGLLGWQRADFDGVTQREVDKLHDVEREQSRLTNASAALACEIHALNETGESTRQQATAERQQLETERAAIHEPLTALEQQVAILRKRVPETERRIPDLDRELEEVEELYTKLLIMQPQPPQVRDEVFRLRDRLIAIPNEKADLRSQNLRLANDLRGKEKELAALQAGLEAVEHRLRELKERTNAAETQQAAELREKERAKVRLEADAEKLERAKLNPYREIGRVLADSHLPPLNQPHVLERVKTLRRSVQEIEQEITLSRELTARENPTQLRVSFVVWAIVLIGAILIVCVLVGIGHAGYS
jgi:chromosome segregation ATPase